MLTIEIANLIIKDRSALEKKYGNLFVNNILDKIQNIKVEADSNLIKGSQ